VLYRRGCNLEDVTSTILGGHFAMTLLVRAAADVGERSLEESFHRVAADLDLVIDVREVEKASARPSSPTHVLSVYGEDRTGILFKIAAALAANGANVTALTARLVGDDDAPVYALVVEVAVPVGKDIEAELEAVRQELGVELTIRALDADVF
jgi:glycine cleavage system transcriptional repressor